MKRELLRYYRSPGVLAPLALTRVDEETEIEVRAGELRCTATGRTFEIKDGAPHLIVPEHLSAMLRRDQELIEQCDRAEFAQVANNTWPEEARIAREGYEKGMQANTEFMFQTLKFAKARKRNALEFGAGDTKLAARVRELGFSVFAMDFVGLRICTTADNYMPKSGYFERVVGLMEEMPFPPETFDLVYMHAALHHATPLRESDFAWCSPDNLGDALLEIRRVLKPREKGGMLIIMGEGVYPENTPVAERHYERTAQSTGCYESWYTLSEYEAQFRKADIFPNLWTNQANMVMSAHGYERDGTRVTLLGLDEGLTVASMDKVTEAWRRNAGQRLQRILPAWFSVNRPSAC